MNPKILERMSGGTLNHAHFGSELAVGPWQVVSLNRIGNPPLRFTGRQLSHHWQHLYANQPIFISVWQRRKTGLVVAHSMFSGGQIKHHATSVTTLCEAATYLEKLCEGQSAEPYSADHHIETVLYLQRSSNFTQVFSFLVGEALGCWDGQTLSLDDMHDDKEATK